MSNRAAADWRAWSASSLAFVVGAAVLAALLDRWVLTALPVGFLFGFFLQKGDLCGASAMSEVLLMRDGRKLLGVWIAIVVGMAGFAALDLAGWVRLSPKPLLWGADLVGGLVFGAGTVLAGGCVSGCMYKAATGNLNSMAGLVGIPLGVALVEAGPLRGVGAALKATLVKGPGGGVMSLPAVTGAPFWVLAAAIATATGIALALGRRSARAVRGQLPEPEAAATAGARSAPAQAAPAAGRSSPPAGGPPEGLARWERALTRPWRPWQAGLAIGLLAAPAYLSSAASGRNYPLGVTHGVYHIAQLATDHGFRHIWTAAPAGAAAPASSAGAGATAATAAGTGATQAGPAGAAASSAAAAPAKPLVWWLVLVVAAAMPGAWVAGRLSGQARLLPKPPEETLTAFGGGVLVGVGAAIGTGCVIGNIISGWALLSVGMFLFGAATLLGNWVVTYLYLMGGGLRDLKRAAGR